MALSIDEQREENEKKKKFLNGYRNAMKKLCSLNEQREQIKTEIEQAKCQPITDMPRGGRQQDLSDYIARLQELEDKICRAIREVREIKLHIQSVIVDVKDGVESEVLRLRYIELRPWESICTEIGYGWRQTHNYHSRALSKLNIPERKSA